jgi:hypothetical protein
MTKTTVSLSAVYAASLLLAGCSQSTAPRSADVDIALSAAELNDLQLIETAYSRHVPMDPKAVADEISQRPIPLLASVQFPIAIEKAASYADKIDWNGTNFVPKTGPASVNDVFSSLTPDERNALSTLDHLVDRAQEICAKEFAAAHDSKPKNPAQPAPGAPASSFSAQ